MLTPLQMETIAKEQIRDRQRERHNDYLAALQRSSGALESGSRPVRLISIVLKLEHTLVQWLARDYQRRSLHRAVTVAFARFGRLHPQWAASLFNRDFVTHHLLPMLILALETGVPVTPENVAEQYAAQASRLAESHGHSSTEVMSAAATFLRLVDAALEDTRMPIPATGTQFVSRDLTVLS